MPSFHLEDKVFYPGHGVALINKIIDRSINGKIIRFFQLRFLYKNITILIPVDSNSNPKIRYLSKDLEIAKALRELNKIQDQKTENSVDFLYSNWNKRNKSYQLKIQRGDILEIISIYKDLMLASQNKELSFGEKMFLEKIEELLLQEIQVVQKKDRETVIKELRSPFQRRFVESDLKRNTRTATL